MRYGMNEKLGLIAYETESHAFLNVVPSAADRNFCEQTAREIDCAVRDLVHDAFLTATGILTRARAIVERGARSVLEKESIGEAELAHLNGDLERVPGLGDSGRMAPQEAGSSRARALG